MQNNKIQLTADGSHTVHSSQFDALYHSKHGAIQESLHVFIDKGLSLLSQNKSINILEMGFGTGLNLFLTYLESENLQSKIFYESIEAYPISSTIASDLNYASQLNREDHKSFMEVLHASEWEKEIILNSNFSYRKRLDKIQDVILERKYDLVYYDAFSPLCQEELWTSEIFEKIASNLNHNAILVSYCCKGDFKRALVSAGFKIEKIPGPPGKREMIRAYYQ